MMYEVHEPRILIVGGGLVGLSAALFLRHQGVAAVLVERRPTTSPQPKARRINLRTMELFRQLELTDTVLAAAANLSGYQAMAAGPTLAQARRLPFTLPGGVPEWDTITPATACLCAQDELEPTLRRVARERGCDVRFGVECTEFAEDATGIEATLRAADGGVERIRVDYLIAADGAASPIRERLGIARSGRGSLGRAVNVYFRADLRELVRGREFNLCQVDNEAVPGAFASVDGAFRWIFSTSAGVDRPLDRWPQALRTAIGVPDLPLEVLSVLPWEPGMFVADRYRCGRVFLAGDAAHVMPPYAAAGANTGIQDVHNLAWKLAHVLRGVAGPALLDSYHAERHPIGWYVADQSSVRIPCAAPIPARRPLHPRCAEHRFRLADRPRGAAVASAVRAGRGVRAGPSMVRRGRNHRFGRAVGAARSDRGLALPRAAAGPCRSIAVGPRPRSVRLKTVVR
nr:FAD-dependent monooxygenase [Nocardia wallacei]